MGLGSQAPKETIGTQDILVFNALPFQQDKIDVNRILATHGIQYPLWDIHFEISTRKEKLTKNCLQT